MDIEPIGRTSESNEEAAAAPPDAIPSPEPRVTPSAVRAATGGGDLSGDSLSGETPSSATEPADATPETEATAQPTAVAVAVDEPTDEPREDESTAASAADDEAPIPDVDEDDEIDDEVRQAWRAVPLDTRIEALLFAATAPLSMRRLQRLADEESQTDVRDVLDALNLQYEESGRAFAIEAIGGGYQMRTRPDLYGLVARLGRRSRSSERLSAAALETLAIVAYRQPVLRADVEKIRGVASGEVLRTLIEKGLARVAGRADLPGAPLLYGTTPMFLELFGLRSLQELPSDRELLRRPV